MDLPNKHFEGLVTQLELFKENQNLYISDEKVVSNYHSIECELIPATDKTKLLVTLVCSNVIKDKSVDHELRRKYIELFARYYGTKIFRKHLLEIVIKNADYFSQVISCSLANIQKDFYETKRLNLLYCQHVLYFLDICLPQLKTLERNVVENVLEICTLLIAIFTLKLRSKNVCKSMLPLLDSACKVVLTSYAKKTGDEYPKTAHQLLQNSYELMILDDIDFDMRKKCGLIFVSSYTRIPIEEKRNIELDLIKLNKTTDEVEFLRKLLIIKHTRHVETIIYSSVASTLETSSVVDKTPLLSLVYHKLIDIVTSSTSVPELVVEISKTLCQMQDFISKVEPENLYEIFSKGLNHVWTFIEHPINFVRHHTKSFFICLVKTASFHYKNGFSFCINLLIKRITSITNMCQIYFTGVELLIEDVGSDFVLRVIPDIKNILLTHVFDTTLGQQASNTYINLIKKRFCDVSNEDWILTFVTPVVSLLRKSEPPFREHLEKIILSACQILPKIFSAMFPGGELKDVRDSVTMLKCLQFVRNTSLVKPDSEEQFWKGLIKKSKLDLFAIHQDDQIRLSALSVIIESQKTTELYTEYELNFLLEYLNYNIAAEVPSTRKRMISLYKKAFARYDASYKVIVREVMNLEKKHNQRLDLEPAALIKIQQDKEKLYKQFLMNSIKDLISNLFPGANYPRRSSALALLLEIHPYTEREEWMSCWNRNDFENLILFMYDSYEANKIMALELCEKFTCSELGFTNQEESEKYLRRALKLARDIKPVNTLSAAYMLQLIIRSPCLRLFNNNTGIICVVTSLSTKLLLITNEYEKDILKAASSEPLYGLLLCLSHLIKKRNKQADNCVYKNIFSNIITIAKIVLEMVNPVICNPSPEGYLPENDSEVVVDQSAAAQMVLVYAWRTMKELTLLLSEIVVQNCQIEDYDLLSDEDLHFILDIFLDIFIQTKHRGVFEQAFVGFSAICEAFWRSQNDKYNMYPQEWLEKALGYCTGKLKHPMLCSTRRSAGLPFLLLSVVRTHPSINEHFMDEVMNPLLETAKGDNVEAKTHCLNTLRAIFRNTELGEHVVPYVPPAVEVAINGYKSEIWGVRNSATLLYSSLITRIFGVQRTQDPDDLTMKNKLTVKVFTVRYPKLLDFLLNTLSEECRQGVNKSIVLYPVLLILSRLCSSYGEDFDVKIRNHFPIMNQCLSHPAVRIRELVVRASLAFMLPTDILAYVNTNFYCISVDMVDNNVCSGLIVQLIHLLKRVKLKPHHEPFISDYILKSLWILDNIGVPQKEFIVILYMEMLTRLLLSASSYSDMTIFEKIIKVIKTRKGQQTKCFFGKYSFHRIKFLLNAMITFRIVESFGRLFTYVRNEIMHYLNDNDIEMKQFCFKFLIYLNEKEKTPDEQHKMHPLFEFDDIELPKKLCEVIDATSSTARKTLLLQIHPYLVEYFQKNIIEKSFCDKDVVEFLLLLCHYPCAVIGQSVANNFTSQVIDKLLTLLEINDEDVVSADLTCVCIMLKQTEEMILDKKTLKRLINVLTKSSRPESPEHLRLSVCRFLLNFQPWKHKCSEFEEDDILDIFDIIMVLLEDDDLTIRNSISTIFIHLESQDSRKPMWSPIPDITRSELFKLCFKTVPASRAIAFIISWVVKCSEIDSSNASEVFDRSESNQYADSIVIVKAAVKALKEHLGSAPVKPSGEEFKMYNLNITDILLESLNVHRSLLQDEVIVILIDVLNSIKIFVDLCCSDNDPYEKLALFLNSDSQTKLVSLSHFHYNIVKYLLLGIYTIPE